MIVCAVLVLLSACSILPTDSDVSVVGLERNFTLAQGRSAVVLEPRLVVEFVEVVEDGRCREGMLCFGMGTFTVRLRASIGDAPPETLDVRSHEGGYAIYHGYGIYVQQLLPDPPPAAGDPAEYRIRLRVAPYHIAD
jgi:hypothetical protein